MSYKEVKKPVKLIFKVKLKLLPPKRQELSKWILQWVFLRLQSKEPQPPFLAHIRFAKKGKIKLCLLSYSRQSMALPLSACYVPAYYGTALKYLPAWEGRIPNTFATHAKLLSKISLFSTFKISPIPSAALAVMTFQYLSVYSAF